MLQQMGLFDVPRRRVQNRRVPKSYLTVREIMDRTGWTRQWINSLIKRGKLKAVQKKNGRWLIEEQSYLGYDPEADKGGRPATKRGKAIDELGD